MRHIVLLLYLLPAAAAQDLEWVNPQPIVLDQNGAGSVAIVLRNNTKADMPLALVVDPFTHTAGGRAYPLKSTAAPAPPLPAGSKVPANGTFAFTIAVTNVTAAGASTAKIWNAGQNFAQLTAIRVPAAYDVQVVSPAPDNPEIHIVGGEALFTLKNADATPYQFHWKLRYAGAIYEGADFLLPAAGTTDLRLPAPQALGKPAGPSSGWLWSGTLKDETAKASLILTPDLGPEVSEPAAAKEIPAGVRFSFWSANWQEFWNGIFTFLLLAVGGFASLIVNSGIPNTKGALALIGQFRGLREKVRGLDSSISSQWRALLESKLKGLSQQLRASPASWILPSFSTVLDGLNQSSNMLQQWVDITYETSVLGHDAGESAAVIPPTVRRDMQAHCEQALSPMKSGFTSAAEITGMKNSLDAAKRLLDITLSGAANGDLESRIKERETRADLATLAETQQALFGGLIERARTVFGNPLSPEVYVERDVVSWKIDLVRRCDERARQLPAAAAAAAGGGASQPVRDAGTRLQAQGLRLSAFLIPDRYEYLETAEMVVGEMQDDVYAEGSLLAALTASAGCEGPSLRIDHEPAQPSAGQPAQLRLLFGRDDLNHVAARGEWKCRWDFGDGSRDEIGWEVWHTFNSAGSYKVSVTLWDLSGACVQPTPDTREITVGPAASTTSWMDAENLLEAGRICAVLAIAFLGLMTAAEQKVQSLTFFQAVSAVIGLGFGADTVKNLILRSSQ